MSRSGPKSPSVVAVPLILLLVAAPFLRLGKLNHDLSWFVLSILAAALILFTFLCAGFAPTTRYEVDFMPMLLLALAIIVLCIDHEWKPHWVNWSLRTGLAVLVFYSVGISAAMSYSGYGRFVRVHHKLVFHRDRYQRPIIPIFGKHPKPVKRRHAQVHKAKTAL